MIDFKEYAGDFRAIQQQVVRPFQAQVMPGHSVEICNCGMKRQCGYEWQGGEVGYRCRINQQCRGIEIACFGDPLPALSAFAGNLASGAEPVLARIARSRRNQGVCVGRTSLWEER